MKSSRIRKMKLFSTSIVLMFCSSVLFSNCTQNGFQVSDTAGEATLGSSGEPLGIVVNFTKVPLNMVNANSISFAYEISGQNASNVSAKCYLNQTLQADCTSPIDVSLLPDADYTLTINATNQNSLVLATAKRSFRLDRRAPVLTINQAPSGTLSSTSASISFSVTDNFPGAVAYCSLDSAAFTSCSSPYNLSNLAQGAHSVQLYAQDAAGISSSKQTVSFSVNTTVPSSSIPTVTITQKPASIFNVTSASFSFSGSSSGSTIAGYQCSLDNAAFAACSSPQSYSTLADGIHNFSVKATDALGQPSSAVGYSFAVDTIKPSAPSVNSDQMNPTKSTALNLTFNSTDASGLAKYECKLDAGSYTTCVSPQAFSGLSNASHSFAVRATDNAGNVSAEGSYSMLVDTVAPVVTISSQPASSTQSTSASFAFSISDALSGVNLIECQLDSQAYVNCSSPQAYSNLAVGSHTFNLRGTDKAGNSKVQSYSWSIAAASTPTPSPSPSPGGGGIAADEIFDSSGNLIGSAYVAMANDFSSDAAIAYRFGAANSAPAAGAPTYWKPSDSIFYPHGNKCYQQEFPNDTPDTSLTITAQLGSVDCSRNDYGSTMGDVIYRADSASSNPGVTPLLTLDLSAGVITEKPQLFWIYGNNKTTDPLLEKVNGGTSPMKPIAMGRCVEHDCAQALVAFQDGTMAGVGSNTASQTTKFKWPAGKVPTAIAITNNSEFALVTIWDTINLKGQVAVLALGSLADGGKVGGPYDPSPMTWPGLYPGIRQMSNFVFIKLLGFIDLPGMVAPIGISASTDFSVMQDNGHSTQGWLYDPVGGTGADFSYQELNLVNSQANQKSFAVGGLNASLISRSGVAVVISKSEKKAIFLNLKPLFDKMNNSYFEASFTSMKAMVANTGLGDSQWPPVFAVDNYAPTILKTVSFAQKPTAVSISILANPGQAWIGTEDGVIHSFNVAGVQSGSNMDPSLISEVGSLQVGKNPTSIVHHVLTGLGIFGSSNTEVWVVSRGDQKVQLVDMVAKKIQKTLQDSRLVDPITVDETQQSPMLTSVITLTDYSGKQVMNYRYAPIDLQGGNAPLHIGIGQSGNDLFEFGGAYSLPGKPFNFTGSNIP